ncbi:unnamed protein product, partial [Laminaria digitata]
QLSSAHGPQPTTRSPIKATTPLAHMAGTEVPPSVCEISNALANGQDKTEPSQKRRRKSGGNGADAHRDDALDRSGQDQLEEEDRGTLGARAEASDKVGNPSRQGRG